MLKINLRELLEVYQVDKEWHGRPDSRFPIKLVIDGKQTEVIDHQVVFRAVHPHEFISVAAEKDGIVHVLSTLDTEESEKLRFYKEIKPERERIFVFDHIWIKIGTIDITCGVMSPPRVPFRRVFWERKFYSKRDRFVFGCNADTLAEAEKAEGRTVKIKTPDATVCIAKFSGKNLLNCAVLKGYSNVRVAKAVLNGYNQLTLLPGKNEVTINLM